jgi:16S rRNA (cytosine1402-N4)-methyltransferase
MALRIAVNQEVEELKTLLDAAPSLLRPGGRMVVLTFMSAEDRIVKQAFQQLARVGKATVLTKHVIPPSDEEVRANPPSRSAKLRAVELK